MAGPGQSKARASIERALALFEDAVVVVLIFMVCIGVTLSLFELGATVLHDIRREPFLRLDAQMLFDLFGFVLVVLIGIELLESIKAYLRDHAVHVEIVLEVAIIALARKVIVLDLEKYSSLSLFALAALLLTLSVAFFLERKARLAKKLVE